MLSHASYNSRQSLISALQRNCWRLIYVLLRSFVSQSKHLVTIHSWEPCSGQGLVLDPGLSSSVGCRLVIPSIWPCPFICRTGPITAVSWHSQENESRVSPQGPASAVLLTLRGVTQVPVGQSCCRELSYEVCMLQFWIFIWIFNSFTLEYIICRKDTKLAQRGPKNTSWR